MKKGLFLVCVRSYLNGPLDPVRADPKDPRDPLAEIRMLTFPLGGGENCQKRCEIIFEWPLAPIRTDPTKKAHFGNPLAEIMRIFPRGDGGLKLSNKV